MRVREAVLQDVPDLVRLNGEVQELHIATYPERFKKLDTAALQASFERQLLAENVRCLVAMEGIAVIGYAVLRFIERPENDYCHAFRYAYVDQICVEVAARRKGVAAELFEAMKNIARGAGIGRIELDVWSFNTGAKEAFAALGFETQREVMFLNLV